MRKVVPVYPPDPPGLQRHFDAGDGVRTRKGVWGSRRRPTAILNAPGRVVERRPAQGHAADVGRRWGKRPRKLVPDRRVLRTGIADAPWILGVDRALRRIVRIAEADIALYRCGIRRGH